jgi:glycosyltransferase involved in cell wall biosynthesis
MPRFFEQINNFVDNLTEHKFSISLYENDSTDATAHILKSADLSKFENSSVICETLCKPAFGSVVAEERVKNLAIARNKALTAKDMYMDADYVLFIDCDIKYDNDFVKTLLDFKSSGLKSIDVYSGINIVPFELGSHGVPMVASLPAKENGVPDKAGIYRVYDTWATRQDSTVEWGTWKEDFASNPVSEFWATYNSVCLYNAIPFKDGIRFDHINTRLGKYDLEVAVVCEKFRVAGYKNIYINQLLFCQHI